MLPARPDFRVGSVCIRFVGKVTMNGVVSPLHMVSGPKLEPCSPSSSVSPRATLAELSG